MLSLTQNEIIDQISHHTRWLMTDGETDRKADFTDKYIKDADFQGLNLRASCFQKSVLENVDLNLTNLDFSDFSFAKVIKNSFKGASLYACNFDSSNFTGSDFYRVNLGIANMIFSDFKDSNLLGANLEGANITEGDFRNVILENANLNGAIMYKANFENADFTNSKFKNANFQGANLRGANFTGADFYRANFSHTEVYTFTLGRQAGFYHKGDQYPGGTLVKIGCKEGTIEWWLDNYRVVGRIDDYTTKEIKQYGRMLELLREVG